MKLRRFFYAGPTVPKGISDLLGIDTSLITYADPDTIWRRVQNWDRVISFVLFQRLDGKWILRQTLDPGDTHRDIPMFRATVGLGKSELAEQYRKIWMGRVGIKDNKAVVTFWPTSESYWDEETADYFRMQDQDVPKAVNLLKRGGYISPRQELWAFGPDGDLVVTGDSVPTQPVSRSTQAPGQKYEVQGKPYSLIGLAGALHSLPKSSSEYQAVVQFLKETQAPELQFLKARISEPVDKSTKIPFKELGVLDPEGLEGLGSQSRIDRYWDARDASRRFRVIARLLRADLAGKIRYLLPRVQGKVPDPEKFIRDLVQYDPSGQKGDYLPALVSYTLRGNEVTHEIRQALDWHHSNKQYLPVEFRDSNKLDLSTLPSQIPTLQKLHATPDYLPPGAQVLLDKPPYKVLHVTRGEMVYW